MDWSLDRHLQRRMALTLLALAALTTAFATSITVFLAWGSNGLVDYSVFNCPSNTGSLSVA
ncbi:hypothetical protein ACFQL7_17685 [Halocatena marina]|uniref:Uncharacterized protein n=1 Tax=Halocatena marina TaxID=2934937 RepID=A0ABD5YTY4_9EURY